MKNTGVRLYGKEDIRLEEFDLPAIKEDEILARIVSDSLCMSTYKLVKMGEAHKRAPKGLKDDPVMTGHEFCGEFIEVGAKWKDEYHAGQRFVLNPNLNPNGSLMSIGFSYRFCGGDAMYCIIPSEVLEKKELSICESDAYYYGSLAEPLSCIAGAFRAMYHTVPGEYSHVMGIRPGGKMAILAGCGPMGLGAVDYALHCDDHPSLLVVTDIDDERLGRAERIYSKEEARALGIELHYVKADKDNAADELMRISGGTGYDDVFVFAPVASVTTMGSSIMAFDGCLNFFAGPADTKFSAPINFFDVHYSAHHVCGTSGGSSADLKHCIDLLSRGILNPSAMITHIGGLDSIVDTTLHLPEIHGGKKLIYTHLSMPLTAIEDFEAAGKSDPLFAKLAEICGRHNGLWNPEAEKYLLEHGTQFGSQKGSDR